MNLEQAMIQGCYRAIKTPRLVFVWRIEKWTKLGECHSEYGYGLMEEIPEGAVHVLTITQDIL